MDPFPEKICPICRNMAESVGEEPKDTWEAELLARNNMRPFRCCRCGGQFIRGIPTDIEIAKYKRLLAQRALEAQERLARGEDPAAPELEDYHYILEDDEEDGKLIQAMDRFGPKAEEDES